VKVRNLERFHLRPPIILSALLLILVAVGIFSLSMGRYHVPAATVARILFESVATDVLPNSLSSQETEWIVVRIIRLPRILVVILAGMGLALSGAALQGLLRNPLVGPQIVGVSSGASFGGVLAILLSLPSAGIVGLAFAFGILTLLLVYGLSRLAGRAGGILSLVLAGVILSSFFSALVGVVQYLADPETKLPGIVYWLMGSFAAAD